MSFARSPLTHARGTVPESLIVGSQPAISRIAALPASFEVSSLQLLQPVSRERIASGFDINVVDPGRVEAEDLRLVFFGDLSVAELLAHLIADLEPLEGINYP